MNERDEWVRDNAHEGCDDGCLAIAFDAGRESVRSYVEELERVNEKLVVRVRDRQASLDAAREMLLHLGRTR